MLRGRQERGRLTSLLAVLTMMLWPGWAWAVQTVTLQLRWTPQFQFAGYYVALERGYYRDAGLDVLIRPAAPGTPAPIEAVTSGHADFGTANSGLASARMNSQPVTAVAAVLQHSASVWLVRSQTDQPPDVHDLHDLAQRRLSAIAGPGESVELLAPFLAQGIGADQLHLVPTNYGLEPLLDGTVDAISASLANEPFELRRRGIDFAVVEPSHFGIDFYGEVLFTSDAFAHDHPDAVKRMRAASLRGWAAAFADIEGTARMIHQRYAPGRSVEQLRHEGEVLRQLAEPNKADLGQM
ncbi:MAG: ABC transporter substrate-binding protein, partial [Leptothrix sp. (in: b-proteobacteria)]